MSSNAEPYTRFAGKETILRDELAIDRTVLANERTFLAYVRSALAFGVVGASCLKFFSSHIATIAGLGFLVGAAILAWLGVTRTYRMSRRLAIIRDGSRRDDGNQDAVGAA